MLSIFHNEWHYSISYMRLYGIVEVTEREKLNVSIYAVFKGNLAVLCFIRGKYRLQLFGEIINGNKQILARLIGGLPFQEEKPLGIVKTPDFLTSQ